MKITNNHGISLPVAVWLLHDDYDHINEPNYISATSLLKSTKQLALSQRVKGAQREADLADMFAARFGHAVHDGVEKAWRMSGKSAMKKLGYPEHIYDNIVINPTEEELRASNAIVPVWIEQRSFREIEINGVVYKIGGKYDQVIDGRLFDFKTTSVYTYLLGRKDEDYSWQGSIYRWLNPNLITSDHIYINFFFTDWQKAQARQNPNYPQTKTLEYPVELKSIQETEHWIRTKLQELSRSWNLPEEQLPACNDKELWRSSPQYKYYKDPAKTDGRSTKNFDSMGAAQTFMTQQGGKGIVKTIPGEVKACEYCAAFDICQQKDQYYARSE